MIPKRLHYCWFGGASKPDLTHFCIDSWQRNCPTYEIVEWNEGNFPVDSFPIAAAAYRLKKFAFVSDVARAYALHSEGGIYLDSDLELRRSLDRFLIHSAFTGFERKGIPFTAVWGSVPQHKLAKMVLDYYTMVDITDVMGIPNTTFVSEILVKEFNVNRELDSLQDCAEGLVIYPSNFFCINVPDNYSVHHFAGTWLDEKLSMNYADFVLAEFYAEALKRLEAKGVQIDFTPDRQKLIKDLKEIYKITQRILKRRIRRIITPRAAR